MKQTHDIIKLSNEVFGTVGIKWWYGASGSGGSGGSVRCWYGAGMLQVRSRYEAGMVSVLIS